VQLLLTLIALLWASSAFADSLVHNLPSATSPLPTGSCFYVDQGPGTDTKLCSGFPVAIGAAPLNNPSFTGTVTLAGVLVPTITGGGLNVWNITNVSPRVNDLTSWIDTLLQGTQSEGAYGYLKNFGMLANVVTTGEPAIVGASRTLDTPFPNVCCAIGITGVTINDNTTHIATGWPVYGTGARLASTGAVQNELDIANVSNDVVEVNPFLGPRDGPPGTSVVLNLGAGGEPPQVGNTPNGKISAFMTMGNNGSVSRKGLVALNTAFDTTVGAGGNGVAGEFASGQSFRWLKSDATTLAEIYGNNGGLVIGGAGVVVGAATGGSQGPGTINVTGCFVNGVACSVGGGAPGGTNGQVQYNNSGAFGGFTFGGDVSFSRPNITNTGLQGRPVSAAAPATTNVLAWNGSSWAPTAATGGTGTVGSGTTGQIATYPSTGTAVSGVSTIGSSNLTSLVSAGSCTNCNVTFDAAGRATAYSNGSGGGGVSVTSSSADIEVNPSPGLTTFTVGSSEKFNDQSGNNYTVLTSDATKVIEVGNHTYTLPQAGTTGFGSGWGTCFLNVAGAGNATINTTTSVFKGAGGTTSLTIAPKAWECPGSDGTNYVTLGGASP
jgi:hypothetical protein